MTGCSLERPQCKRALMASNTAYEEKRCPLNVVARCRLVPPSCPLLPERNLCALSPVAVSQCPAKTPCALAPRGCPFDPSVFQDPLPNQGDNTPLPSPCPLQKCTWKNSVPSKKREDSGGIKNKNTVESTKCVEKELGEKRGVKRRVECPLSSNVRPLPCSECILDELSVDAAGGDRTKVKCCPFLKIADSCGRSCDCKEVPPLDAGPTCPFLPQPCPCCRTPRCPVSRQPDCPLSPKPRCGVLQPPCVCGTNCLGDCFPPNPCGSCFDVPGPCSLCPPGSSCPLNAPKCLCGSCPLSMLTCILHSCTKPTSCPLNSCTKPASCPLKPPACPVSATSCPLTLSPSCPPCDPCPLLQKPICPPIPPPCSINNYELQPIPPKTTFHVPLCPQYKPPCKLHVKPSENNDVYCPFSPHPCPLGETCPFPIRVSKVKNVTEMEVKDTGKESEPALTAPCPASGVCGVVPVAECPAAEILCPKKYRRKPKPKKEECPLKECMRKAECPLSAAMPSVDCPLKAASDCPLSKEPDCPVAELASKCPLKTKACPLSQACPLSKPADCALSAITADCPLLSKPDCPLAPKPDCPLAPNPGCPLAEFANVIPSPKPLKSPQPITSSFGTTKSEKRKSCPIANPSECILSKIYPGKGNTVRKSETKTDGTMQRREMPEWKRPGGEKECPLSGLVVKRSCPLAPPACPLTPKPTCPLRAKPEPCPLLLPTDRPYCPVEYPPCFQFPTGRCPMTALNLCECEYPVAPCLLPPCPAGLVAPPQYCTKEQCCMGLPYPPTRSDNAHTQVSASDPSPFPSLFRSQSYYYHFLDTKPGKEETKHYVEVTEVPPTVIGLFGDAKQRVSNNWTIVKQGEGYKKCKNVAKKLESMGETGNVPVQYDERDCPMDLEVMRVKENRKQDKFEEIQLEMFRHSLTRKNK